MELGRFRQGHKFKGREHRPYAETERLAVRAAIHTLNGFSAHAGQGDLLRWFEALAPSKPRVIMTHGEDPAREALSGLIRQRFRLQCELPGLGDVIEV